MTYGSMHALLFSFLVVAAAELGDKTQLIALCFAAQFRRPVPVLLGILAATIAGNLLAALIGQWLGIWLNGRLLQELLAASFIIAAIWAFIPEKSSEEITCPANRRGIFIAAFITFFLAELGDKTQLATAGLAAQFQSLSAIVTGTTLGMMAVNIPTVLLSHAIAGKISINKMRMFSGVAFALTGVYELWGLFRS